MRAPPESVRGEVREPAWGRSYGEAAMDAWSRAPWPVGAARDARHHHAREAAKHAQAALGVENDSLRYFDAGFDGAAESGLHISRHLWLRAVQHLLRALALALLFLPSFASAQTNVDRLLRTVVSECGFDCTDDEIAALHLVISSTAEREGVRYATAWRLLSPRLAAGTVSRRWVAHLDNECREPEGWPEHYERDGEVLRHPAWSVYRPRCEALVVRVRAVIDGVIVHRCESVPRSWGSEADASRDVPGMAFVVVDCGSTANRFGEWLPVDAE